MQLSEVFNASWKVIVRKGWGLKQGREPQRHKGHKENKKIFVLFVSLWFKKDGAVEQVAEQIQ
jgi:hypothetical protein